VKRWLLVPLAALVVLCACDEDAPPDGSDGGLPPGADGGDPALDAGDEVVELDDYLRDNDVVTLEALDDGTEVGTAITGDDGFARFYSPENQGIYQMQAADPDMGMALPGRQVTVAVGDSSMAYLITDPLGQYQPFLHTVDVPEEDAELEYDAYDVYREQAGLDDYDPGTGPNPFGAMSDDDFGRADHSLTIVGIAVTIGIRSILTSVAVGAAAAVFSNLVEGACNAVAPLYAERCRIVGVLAGAVGSLVGGFFTGPVTAWALGATALDTALSVAELNCDNLAGAAVGYVLDPGDDTGQNRYREIARKLNYLLHVMETDPQPGQPSWDWAMEQAQRLIAVRDVVRNRYFQLWNQDGLGDSKAFGFGMGRAASATSGFFNNLEVDVRAATLTRLTIREETLAVLEIGEYDARYTVANWRYVQADWETFEWSYDPGSEFSKEMRGLLIGCAFNFVKGAVVAWSDGTTSREVELETADMVDDILDVFETGIEETYRRHWGDDIPMGDCLPDLQEPNGTWELAHASPVPGDLVTGGVAELMDLNLCNPAGTSGEDEDWYAYDIAPIELRVQARLIGDDMGMGQDERMCIEVYFYSEIYTITGDPPDRITGTCGPVSSWPATMSFGVRRTAGERWSQILLRVTHEDPTSTQEVDYGLRFIP